MKPLCLKLSLFSTIYITVSLQIWQKGCVTGGPRVNDRVLSNVGVAATHLCVHSYQAADWCRLFRVLQRHLCLRLVVSFTCII